jgi:DNA polymerase-3 subunit epsilon
MRTLSRSSVLDTTPSRLSTRMVRHLRARGIPQHKEELAEQVLASTGKAWASLLDRLLDGRFEQGETVGLWEWKFPFPPDGEPLVVLDIETTGLSPEQNEIIEIAMVRLENGSRSEFVRLVDPGLPIPPFITRLTGIRSADVRGQPDVYEVLEEALPFMQGATLMIQNAPFDLSFIRPRLGRLGHRLDNPVLDTIALARKALPALPRRGLDVLAEAFDLRPGQNRHRALGDVELTYQAAHEMYYMLAAGRPLSLRRLIS